MTTFGHAVASAPTSDLVSNRRSSGLSQGLAQWDIELRYITAQSSPATLPDMRPWSRLLTRVATKPPNVALRKTKMEDQQSMAEVKHDMIVLEESDDHCI